MKEEESFLQSIDKEVEILKNGDFSLILKGVKQINERIYSKKINSTTPMLKI